MKQIIYAMQFKGSAAPKAGVSGVIEASTTAPSCTIGSAVGSDGVTGTLMPAPGGQASFESEVTLIGETSFTEAGTIRFGDSNHLPGSALSDRVPRQKSGRDASAWLSDVAGGRW